VVQSKLPQYSGPQARRSVFVRRSAQRRCGVQAEGVAGDSPKAPGLAESWAGRGRWPRLNAAPKVIGRFPGETSCLTVVWAVLDLYITHAKNGVRFSQLERQRLRRIRHAGSQPTTDGRWPRQAGVLRIQPCSEALTDVGDLLATRRRRRPRVREAAERALVTNLMTLVLRTQAPPPMELVCRIFGGARWGGRGRCGAT
jgi:hypothetical protein